MSDIRASSFEGSVAVTPTDTTPISKGPFAALYIGGAGNVSLTDAKGNRNTYAGLVAGTVLPIQGTIVWATGTTATNIRALYATPLGGR